MQMTSFVGACLIFGQGPAVYFVSSIKDQGVVYDLLSVVKEREAPIQMKNLCFTFLASGPNWDRVISGPSPGQT